MGCYGFDDVLHPFHDVAKVKFNGDRFDAEFGGARYQRQQAGSADQGFGRDAAGIEAIAPHFMPFDQRDFGFDGSGNVGGDQPGRACR